MHFRSHSKSYVFLALFEPWKCLESVADYFKKHAVVIREHMWKRRSAALCLSANEKHKDRCI